MRLLDVAALPACEGPDFIGVVTAQDIATRRGAEGFPVVFVAVQLAGFAGPERGAGRCQQFEGEGWAISFLDSLSHGAYGELGSLLRFLPTAAVR